MCFRKKEVIISCPEARFPLRSPVQVRVDGGLRVGFVISSKKDENGDIVYQINVGGECPFVLSNIKEKEILPFR